MAASPAGLAQAVARWQAAHGRHHLPWQGTRDPYRIWLAEIMLQQTQVAAVIAYYQRFLTRFPDLAALARATQDEVMPYWAGLGYYARARNLHRCAQAIVRTHGGNFPRTAQQLAQLPGIGRSTAAAIAAFAWGERSPILDGNVRRVFCRYFGLDQDPTRADTQALLWRIAADAVHHAPQSLDMRAYTQGLMDLGATVCTRTSPTCPCCPLTRHCHARKTGRQASLPAPKARKTKPERACHMLIVRRTDHILLQQRPAPGVWGGLWSLPQYADRSAMTHDCHTRGLDASQAQTLAGLQHVFTHFVLHIQPCLLHTATDPLRLTPTERWQALDALDQAALPAPVRRILAGVTAIA